MIHRIFLPDNLDRPCERRRVFFRMARATEEIDGETLRYTSISTVGNIRWNYIEQSAVCTGFARHAFHTSIHRDRISAV